MMRRRPPCDSLMRPCAVLLYVVSHVWLVSLVVVTVAWPTAAAAPVDKPAAPSELSGVSIVGLRVKPREWVWGRLGVPPAAPDQRDRWVEAATLVLEEAYQAEGYDWVRTWRRKSDDGTWLIEVDEGRVDQVIFTGADTLRGLVYQWNMHLPHAIFHAGTVELRLRELEERYNLVHARYEQRTTDHSRVTASGFVASQRVLAIWMVGREPYGWNVGVRFNAQWGVLPYVGISGRSWFFDGDRFRGEAGISVPYRQFLFEESPVWRWVHGHLDTDYLFPPLASVFAPNIAARFDSSVYRREDLGVRTYHELEAQATIGVAFLVIPELTLSLGGGVDWIWAGAEELVEGAPVAEGAGRGERLRGLVRFRAETDLGDGALRLDLRDKVVFDARLAASERGEVLVDTRLTFRWTAALGAHDLVVSGRGLWLGGDVQFWDEEPLTGDYSRIFFEGRYWVREALQMQVNMRFSVKGESIKLGVFDDLSFFGDRTGGENRLGFGNGAGPSMHFLLFDLLGLDLYYALGFDRTGFEHNFAFSLGTVY